MKSGQRDAHLEEYLAKIDGWVTEGRIPAPSKVIPVMRSLQGLQWILPTQQAAEILRNMRTFAQIGRASCRERV
jgi:hypothetical protein